MSGLIINKLRSYLPVTIVVFWVIAFFADAQDKGGEGAHSCSLSTTFYNYDIESLADQNFSVLYDSGEIFFSICAEYDFEPECPIGAAVCIKSGNTVFSGGSLDSQKLSVTGDGESVEIVYNSGSPCSFSSSWATVISMQCNPTTEIITAYDSECTMNIDILTPAACPKEKKWVVPVLCISIAILVLLAMYPLVQFLRRLNRSRSPSITPASPEEILPLLSPSNKSSLFINEYLSSPHKKSPEDGPPPLPPLPLDQKKFLLDPPTPDGSSKSLKEERRCSIDPEKGMCKICWAQSVNCALIDCGHMLCTHCAANVSTCPFCRRKVITRIKLYYS